MEGDEPDGQQEQPAQNTQPSNTTVDEVARELEAMLDVESNADSPPRADPNKVEEMDTRQNVQPGCLNEEDNLLLDGGAHNSEPLPGPSNTSGSCSAGTTRSTGPSTTTSSSQSIQSNPTLPSLFSIPPPPVHQLSQQGSRAASSQRARWTASSQGGNHLQGHHNHRHYYSAPWTKGQSGSRFKPANPRPCSWQAGNIHQSNVGQRHRCIHGRNEKYCKKCKRNDECDEGLSLFQLQERRIREIIAMIFEVFGVRIGEWTLRDFIDKHRRR